MAKLGQLKRSRNAWIAGVCSGIAERYGVDTIVVRILFVLVAAVTFGIGAIAYLILWIVLPQESGEDVPYEVAPSHAESSTYGNVRCQADGEKQSYISVPQRMAVAIGLLLLFVVVSLNVPPAVPGTQWWQFWPAALVIAGLCLIVLPIKTCHEVAWHVAGIVVVAVAAMMLPMSLGIVSWLSVPLAFSRIGILPIVAVVCSIVGIVRNSNAFYMAAAFCFVAFCLAVLAYYALPGELGSLALNMPNGRVLVFTAPPVR